MTEPGEMPRPGSEAPLADRWLGERLALFTGGPTHRYRARARVREGRVEVEVGLVEYLLVPPGLHMTVPVPRVTEVALYPLGSRTGALPVVIVDLPPSGVVEALAAQGGEVDVRGEPGPGRGVVLVFDDGWVVGCVGPARPPPPLLARRRYGLPPDPTR